jgi:hypothetical protein
LIIGGGVNTGINSGGELSDGNVVIGYVTHPPGTSAGAKHISGQYQGQSIAHPSNL